MIDQFSWAKTNPARAIKIYQKGSRTEAVKAMCIDCSGGSAYDASKCEVFHCPLWCFRPKADKTIMPPGAPSIQELKTLSAKDGRTKNKGVLG